MCLAAALVTLQAKYNFKYANLGEKLLIDIYHKGEQLNMAVRLKEFVLRNCC